MQSATQKHTDKHTHTHAHVAVSAKHGSEFRLNLKFIYEQYVCTPGHARAPRVGTIVYENVSSNGGAFQRAPGMVGSFPIEAAVTFPFHSAQQFDGLAGCGSALFALLTLQFRHKHRPRYCSRVDSRQLQSQCYQGWLGWLPPTEAKTHEAPT